MQLEEEAHGAATAGQAGFDRLRDGARLHGCERRLRASGEAAREISEGIKLRVRLNSVVATGIPGFIPRGRGG